MDHDAIAAMFTPDGALERPGGTPVVGRDSIAAFLRSFARFRVKRERMSSDSVRVSGDSAKQWGEYWQRVRLPEGRTVDVHGHYATEWRREADGEWRVSRMATTPQNGK